MNNIIFLDIDGVINVLSLNYGSDKFGQSFHPPFVNNLRRVIAESNAKIVISSSWGDNGMKFIQDMWVARGLPGEVIDIIPNEVDVVNSGGGKFYDLIGRGDQIELWLKLNPVDNYVIIDDQYQFTDDQKDHVVLTSMNKHKDSIKGIGLTKQCADDIIKIFKINKMSERLEFRMYGLVPYQLIGIQKGIQYGHALQEYNNEFFKEINYDSLCFKAWSIVDKTFILLNGGTTNLNEDRLGTMNMHLKTLQDNDIQLSAFYEPDLGDQLTAIDFIVDERVFNKRKYPDFKKWLIKEFGGIDPNDYVKIMFIDSDEKLIGTEEEPGEYYSDYQQWVEMVGGNKIVFLRNFLSQFKLA